MLEWLWRLIDALRGRESAEQQRRDLLRDKQEDRARENFEALTHAYNDLMSAYQKLNQEMRQEFEQRLENNENRIASLEAALEKEQIGHRECQKELKALRAEMDKLKGQVEVIKQNQQDDNAGS